MIHRSSKIFCGLDGCRGGWAAVILQQESIQISLFSSIETFARTIQKPFRVLIDMPIGLADSADRPCENAARSVLKFRKQSVFNVPVRDAVYAENYLQACDINSIQVGKKLSKQAWNITPKIRELDQFLQKNRSWVDRVFESHPELCFQKLAPEIEFESKKTGIGQKQRLSVIEKILPKIGDHITQTAGKFKKSALIDDLIDAAILAVSAQMPIKAVDGQKMEDRFKLPMNIWMPIA